VDKDENAPAASLSDEFYPVDIADKVGVLQIAQERDVDCVMPLNEFGMLSHAHCIEELGLPGNCSKLAEALVDKERMRRVWQTAGLSQPRFSVFSRVDDAYKAAKQIGYPSIMKPADSGGSGRGIMIVTGREDIKTAFTIAHPFARNGRILLEEFIEGTELTIEGLVCEGAHTILACSDKFKPPLKTRVATSLNYQALFSSEIMQDVNNLVDAAVHALGITHSATHTEVILTPDEKPYLVEMGGRGGGGHIFSTIVEATSGLNMPALLARILSGETPEVRQKYSRGACYRFFNPPAGRLCEIKYLEEAACLPGVLDIGVVKKPGDIVGYLPNSLSRVGYVVTTGQNRQEAWERANLVEETVQFVVAPFNPGKLLTIGTSNEI
jgi:biotin carboxylase